MVARDVTKVEQWFILYSLKALPRKILKRSGAIQTRKKNSGENPSLVFSDMLRLEVDFPFP